MVLLEVENICKEIDGKIIVDGISFKQETLQKIAIAGESGAGKTTLLKMIAAHLQPTGGTVLFDGERVIGPDENLLPGHKHIAYLSQHYELRNNYRVEELIWFENKLSEEETTALFEICRINHLRQRRTDQLSGGEKQRISLCMLLVKQPKLLVLDEPFSNLDPIHTDTLKAVLEAITERLQITCLLTSHDPHDTLSWADKIFVMKQGKILQQGTPQEIYYKPIDEYVAGMFGKYNLLKPTLATLFGIKTNGNAVITRPEKFMMSTKGSGIKGIVQKISFWGSFYEAEVLLEQVQITVRLLKNDWNPGEEIYLSFK
jgi:ABC-type sugar transport system ATPase subunit